MPFISFRIAVLPRTFPCFRIRFEDCCWPKFRQTAVNDATQMLQN